MKTLSSIRSSVHERILKLLFISIGAVGIAVLASSALRLSVTNNDLRLDRAFRLLGPVAQTAQQLVDQLCRVF